MFSALTSNMFSYMIKGCYNRELKQRNTLDADSMTQINKGRFDKATLSHWIDRTMAAFTF